ncbi:MAG: acyltransferase [Lachnospiraceae bacterium]|nr:acyltransferase [Lachnospiraceae bacterium]
MVKEYDTKNNLFGILKYWAAFSVFMLHYGGFWRIYRGYLLYVEWHYEKVTFFPPVIIFLAISGFLTAGSLDRSGSVREFFSKRIKRIYIPLWISTIAYLIMYLIIARDRIDGSIILWLLTSLVGIAYTPSCLADFVTGSANGVLWTITVLIELYVISGLLWKYIKKISAGMWLVILPLLALANVGSEFLDQRGGIAAKLLERTFIPFAVFYFLGMAAYLYRRELGNKLHLIGAAAVIVLLIYHKLRLPDYGYYTGIVRGLLTSLAAVGIGSWSPEKIGDKGLAGMFGLFSRFDFTYEIYLYQWAVFTVLIFLGIYETGEWYSVYYTAEYSVYGVSLVMYLLTRLLMRKLEHKSLDKLRDHL